MDELNTSPQRLGFGQAPEMNAPVDAVSPVDQAQQQMVREAGTTTGDYIGSILRQDWVGPGALAAVTEHTTLTPDTTYDAYSDPKMPDVSRGIWPEFQKNLYDAHSAAHRDFIAERLRQKQEDLVRLGDLGWKGNVGRFVLGSMSPDQLLMAMAGGWVARSYKAFELATAAKVGVTALDAATATAGVVAKQAAAETGSRAILAGVGSGVIQNAAYEKVRQSVNFEDDTGAVVEAGIVGAAFTLPFAIMGSRGASVRASDVALKEHEVFNAFKAVQDGAELSPQQGRMLDQAVKVHDAIKNFEAGHLDEVGVEKAVSEYHGPQEPDELWLHRNAERLREQAQRIMDDPFADHSAHDVPLNASPAEPPKTATELAFKRAEDRSIERAKATESARVSTDIAAGFDQVKLADESVRKKLLGDAYAQADAANAAAKVRDATELARMREIAHRATHQDPFIAAHDAALKAQEVPSIPPKEAGVTYPTPDHLTPAVEAHPKPTPESFIGQEVSWVGRSGDLLFGDVKSVNEYGRFAITDTHGNHHSVYPRDVTEWVHDPVPDGFLGSSVGARQVHGSVIESIASGKSDMVTVSLPFKGKDGKSINVPIRFDRYAFLNGSSVKKVRELAYILMKDPLQNDKFDAQAMTASEHKKAVHRRLGGQFHYEASLALDAAFETRGVPLWNLKERHKLTKDFYAWTTRALQGDPDVAREAGVEVMKHIDKAVAAQRAFYQNMLKEAKAAGVQGAEDIDVNDFYANRIWNHSKMRDVVAVHGKDAPIDVIAAAIKDKQGIIERFKKSPAFHADPSISDAAILRLKAERFYKAVRSLEFSPAIQDAALGGRDMHTLRQSLKDMDVPEAQIDDLVDLLFEVKQVEGSDAGRTGNLKFRFALDETTKVQTNAGELRLSDMFETDARVLVDTYGGSMGGHIGLAKVGITSASEWRARLEAVSQDALADPSVDGQRVFKELALLEDAYRNITGRPMSTSDFSSTARGAAAFRGYTRAVMLPQLGIAAAFEVSKAVSMFGFKSMWNHSPSLRGFVMALRRGYMPDAGLARDIRLMTGFGYEKAASYARQTELENGWAGRGLTRFEQLSNEASHFVDTMSGNASITSLTKQMSAMGAVQNLADFAHGRRKLDPKLSERWVGQGMSVDDHEAVMASLREFTTEKDGVVHSIRYEDWQQHDPKTYDTFQTFISRQVRDAIQDHDLGETMPFMDSTLGKMFSELKSFFLVGHAKNFLKNLSYHDTTAFHIWGIGFLAESLAYMLQTAVNYPQDLENRLQPDKVATAAFFRMASLGTASLLVESGYSLMTGGDSLVQPGMTANTDNRSFLNTPSLQVAKKLLNAPMTLAGMSLHTDTTTRGEFRDLWSAFPALRLYGLKAVGDHLANSFPASDPEKVRTGH